MTKNNEDEPARRGVALILPGASAADPAVPTNMILTLSGERLVAQPGNLILTIQPGTLLQLPPLLLQSIVLPGPSVEDGRLIEVIMVPWLAMLREMQRDPAFRFQLTDRQFEEFIAAAYSAAGGYDVVLTPRSGDFGRDVIATSRGSGPSVRILDQAKKFGCGNRVTYEAIRAFLFVCSADRATKGFLTTTGEFPPRVMKDKLVASHIGTTIELVNGAGLVQRIENLTGIGRPTN